MKLKFTMESSKNVNYFSEPIQIPSDSIETIALTFSGGGFRATAFGLGVLEYLDRLKYTKEGKQKSLLHNVVYMASASGGSILTMKYALCQAQNGEDNFFQDFKEDMLKIMHECDLLNNSINTLREKNDFFADNKPNLINSFSVQYNKELYYDCTIADLKSSKGHLQELCINCSDLSTGLPFRGIIFFDKKKYIVPHSKFGNSIVNLKENLINKIKLSDLVAASSCFPIGFEPMILTKDFVHTTLSSNYIKGNVNFDENLTTYLENKELFDNREIALLDGGITDNTAIDSLVKSDEDREKVIRTKLFPDIKMYDFIMVNDVGSFNIPPQKFNTHKTDFKLGFLSVRNYLAIILAGISLFIFLIIKPLSYFATKMLSNINGFDEFHFTLKSITLVNGQLNFFIIFSVVMLYLFFNFIFLRSAFVLKFILFFLPKFKINNYSLGLATDFLLTTKIKFYNDMFIDRVKTAKILLSDAFINRIKKLNLENLNRNPRYNLRKKCNNIIDLSTSMINYNNSKRIKYHYSKEEMDFLSQDVTKMNEMADEVCKMPTTLWFEGDYYQNEYLQKIIACGHFTTCHNLLEYFFRNDALKSKYPELFKILKSDFQNFKTNPRFLTH